MATITVALLAASISLAQGPERLELVHADQLVGERAGTRTIRRLDGHVFFRQGPAEMRCDHAVQFVEEGRVIFEGNVQFSRPGMTLVADRITYLERTREEWAEGDVVARDSLRELRCRSLHYQEIPEVGRATGDVLLRHFETRAELQADTVLYRRAEGVAEGWGKPRIVQRDSLEQVTFVLTGKRLRWEEDSRIFLAWGDVRIEQAGSWAKCDTLRYFRDANVAVLRGEPETWRRWERMAGAEMEWYFDGDSLRQVTVRGNAFAVTEADTTRPGERRNQVRGDTLRITFSGGEPHRIDILGRATTLYYLFEEGEPKGANWVLGDRITMFVRAGQVQQVEIAGDPEPAEGKYYPEKIVQLTPKVVEAQDTVFPAMGR